MAGEVSAQKLTRAERRARLDSALAARYYRSPYDTNYVVRPEGKVIHMQDSSFLEEGQGYNQSKVLRFFRNWTPKAVKG